MLLYRAPSPHHSTTHTHSNPLLFLLSIHLIIPSSQSLSSPKPAMKSYTYQPNLKKYDGISIKSLHRYAVKGLSGDSVSSMTLIGGDGTFEDDRRFALLYDEKTGVFDEDNPKWLHKDNFLCAFTSPELLATLDTEYRIQRNDSKDTERLLTVWNRKLGRSSAPLLGPTDLACASGREDASRFFTELCGRKVHCVVASDLDGSSNRLSNDHKHQFGNTSSGVKNNKGDTRTIHIINENTVRQFSEAVYGGVDDADDGRSSNKGKSLSATRFRPNIIVDGLAPWAEFDLIGKTIEVVPKKKDHIEDDDYPLRFRIVSRTVRCAGVGVDPIRPELGVIDIPNLLVKHFPEHGPYLGVYAVMDDPTCRGGVISLGDSFRVV